MKYLLYKSSKLLNRFVSYELLHLQHKLLLSSLSIDPLLRYKLMASVDKLNLSRTKFKRRCVVTGFSRSFRRMSFSRITFREFASYGYLKGIRKSSW